MSTRNPTVTGQFTHAATAAAAIPRVSEPTMAPVSGPARRLHAEKRATLFAEFVPLVQRLIRQYAPSSPQSEELAQEIHCRLGILLDTYDPEEGVPLRPYLVRQLTAFAHTYVSHHRQLQNWDITTESADRPVEPGAYAEQIPDSDPALFASPATTLPAAITQLPFALRQVILLRYYENRSVADIAQTLNIRQATAHSLLRHALTALR